MKSASTDQPPPYEEANGNGPSSRHTQPKAAPLYPKSPINPAQSHQPAPSMPPTTVYHYINPINHDHITSLLPPDDPQMICLQQGSHVRETKFGFLGIMAAILWFPLGIGLCLLDRTVKCKRCGLVLEERVCG